MFYSLKDSCSTRGNQIWYKPWFKTCLSCFGNYKYLYLRLKKICLYTWNTRAKIQIKNEPLSSIRPSACPYQWWPSLFTVTSLIVSAQDKERSFTCHRSGDGWSIRASQARQSPTWQSPRLTDASLWNIHCVKTQNQYSFYCHYVL